MTTFIENRDSETFHRDIACLRVHVYVFMSTCSCLAQYICHNEKCNVRSYKWCFLTPFEPKIFPKKLLFHVSNHSAIWNLTDFSVRNCSSNERCCNSLSACCMMHLRAQHIEPEEVCFRNFTYLKRVSSHVKITQIRTVNPDRTCSRSGTSAIQSKSSMNTENAMTKGKVNI
jgi:hypothetical protein